jgi:hypothetical protein
VRDAERAVDVDRHALRGAQKTLATPNGDAARNTTALRDRPAIPV